MNLNTISLPWVGKANKRAESGSPEVNSLIGLFGTTKRINTWTGASC